MTRVVNHDGLTLIKTFEGLRLKSYLCPAKVWTIGYGHTGPDVRQGQRITEAEAEALLRADLRRFELGVANHTAGVALRDDHFAALVAFAFNVGLRAFANSTLLRRVRQRNAGLAAAEFARWNKAGGKVLSGLTRRRAAEAALFVKGGQLG
jgi:lysozyme